MRCKCTKTTSHKQCKLNAEKGSNFCRIHKFCDIQDIADINEVKTIVTQDSEKKKEQS